MNKLIIIFILIVSATTLNAQGFKVLIIPEKPVYTFEQILKAVPAKQKAEYLDQYRMGVKAEFVPDTIFNAPEWFVDELWDYFNNMRDDSYSVMSGTYVTSEAVYGEDGTLISPTKYANIPKTKSSLVTLLQIKYKDVFSESEINYFVTEMIKYSEVNKSGKYVGSWDKFKTALSNE